MRIKDGFELRVICGEAIVVAHGKENIDFSKIINLNESAAYLWRAVEGKDFDAPMLAHLLTEEYDVDEATALRDATKMMDEWREAGLAS
ncbi:MAG: PqqD family protein [Bacteroidaceae bacterium]|nr:PqqD family protein [Bacteroidaceae bacterium]MBR1799977.1 PqqD family protein [Bacteroidaceae bacterium]